MLRNVRVLLALIKTNFLFESLKNMKYHLVTLGCAKNVSDSEGISTLLANAGHQLSTTSNDADLLIVNTCGFLQAARQESVDVLNKLGITKR